MRELGRKAAIVNNVRQSMASRKALGKAGRLESEFLADRDGAAAGGGMFA